MTFSESPLMRTAQRVISNGQSTAFALYEAVIHTTAGAVAAFRVLDIYENADFINNYRSDIVLHLVVPEGAYKHRIVPSLSELEVTVYRNGYHPTMPFETLGKQKTVKRYRAVLLNAQDSELSQEGITNVGESVSDLGSMVNIKLQLFSEMTEQFRMRGAGGIYRRQPVEDVIRFLLLGESQQLDVQTGDEVAGFEMVPPVDAVEREHIIIPQGIQSYDAPGYIHRHCGGVYSAGFSYFCHEDIWYVFPTYDFSRFNEAKHQLTLILTPPRAMPQVEFTAMKSGSSLTINCTGEVHTSNTSDRHELEQGNGLRFADPQKLLGDAIQVKDNKAIFSRGAANNEFVSKQRANGLNNVRLASNPITSNTLYELSKLAERRGQIITAQWENSDARLLVPGMQVKVMHMHGTEVRTRRGVLVGYRQGIVYTGTGLVSGAYAASCALMIFLENESEQ